jgi:hypothetical protein
MFISNVFLSCESRICSLSFYCIFKIWLLLVVFNFFTFIERSFVALFVAFFVVSIVVKVHVVLFPVKKIVIWDEAFEVDWCLRYGKNSLFVAFFIWILGANLADKWIYVSENICFTGCSIFCRPSQNL